MWPIPTIERELITITCSPKNISCSWIQKTKAGYPLQLRAYERHELHNLELENLTLFNPTHVKQLITNFLFRHNKQNAFVAITLQGPLVAERFVARASSSPKRCEFDVQHSSNLLWDYRYMYPNEQGQFVFYLYSVPRSLLLQYQLLAITAGLNLISITTKRMALLNTYKTIFGSAFRRSQFGIDMMSHHNAIEKLISVDALKRVLFIPPTISLADEFSHLATAYGLFTLEGLSL